MACSRGSSFTSKRAVWQRGTSTTFQCSSPCECLVLKRATKVSLPGLFCNTASTLHVLLREYTLAFDDAALRMYCVSLYMCGVFLCAIPYITSKFVWPTCHIHFWTVDLIIGMPTQTTFVKRPSDTDSSWSFETECLSHHTHIYTHAHLGVCHCTNTSGQGERERESRSTGSSTTFTA